MHYDARYHRCHDLRRIVNFVVEHKEIPFHSYRWHEHSHQLHIAYSLSRARRSIATQCLDKCSEINVSHIYPPNSIFPLPIYLRYRAAELKHGRIAMLAALGQITQYYVRLGDPVFSQVKP